MARRTELMQRMQRKKNASSKKKYIPEHAFDTKFFIFNALL